MADRTIYSKEFEIMIPKKIYAPFFITMILGDLSFVIYAYLKLKFDYAQQEKPCGQRQILTPNITKSELRPFSSEPKENINPLDGCYHVYLDVGSNIGIQIRKLFEPQKYPNAAVHSIFDSNFGAIENRVMQGRTDYVCAVGFEPNFQHTATLKDLEKSYNDCGWRVSIFKETAVSNHNGKSNFYFSRISQRQIGGGIVPPNQHDYYKKKNEVLKSSNVTLLRLSEFLLNIVGKRKIPTEFHDPKFPPKVLMKMDIEGSEIDVLPDLIFTGSLQYINNIMIEWHQNRETLHNRKNSQKTLQNTLTFFSDYFKENKESFDFKMLNVDDETYFMSSFELPKC